MKHRLHLQVLASLAIAVPFAVNAADTATGKLMNAEGTEIGTVQVTDAPNGVLLNIEVQGLTPGWHGLHFHEKGECSDPKFTSAGSHVHAHTPLVHGLLNPEANDAGDLPNLYVHQDGTAAAELYSPLVSLNPGTNRPALLDDDGASVVIHANPDDHQSQPIGGAGARVACAVLG